MILLKFQMIEQDGETVALFGGEEWIDGNEVPDDVYVEWPSSMVIDSWENVPMNFGFTCSVEGF